MCTQWELWWSPRFGSICWQTFNHASKVSLYASSILSISNLTLNKILFLPVMHIYIYIYISVLVTKCFSWVQRLPVIQALAADVRLTTQSLLSQLLQKLRSNIQVYAVLWFNRQRNPTWFIYKNVAFVVSYYYCILLCQLPECLRIIGYLRRIGVFSEYGMRLLVRCNDCTVFLACLLIFSSVASPWFPFWLSFDLAFIYL